MELDPDVVRGARRGHHHVLEIFGHHVVHPEYDSEVIIAPNGAFMERLCGIVKMVLHIILTVDEIE